MTMTDLVNDGKFYRFDKIIPLGAMLLTTFLVLHSLFHNIYIALLVDFVILAKIIIGNSIYIKRKKEMFGSLPAKELNLIENELMCPLFIVKQNYVLTENYLINIHEDSLGIFKYSDIIWMYQKANFFLRSQEKSKIVNNLILFTKEGKSYKFPLLISTEKQKSELKNPVEIIKTKNSIILDDYTVENIKIVKEKYNLKKLKW